MLNRYEKTEGDTKSTGIASASTRVPEDYLWR